MISISELLGRFKNVGLGEKLSKEALTDEINAILGPNTVSDKDITIKNQTALIKGGSALKSEMALHKEEILNRAEEKIGASFVIRDIR